MALCRHQLSAFILWHWGLENGWVILYALGSSLESGACMQDVGRFFVDTRREAGFMGLLGLPFFKGSGSDLKEYRWQKQRKNIPQRNVPRSFLGQLRDYLISW